MIYYIILVIILLYMLLKKKESDKQEQEIIKKNNEEIKKKINETRDDLTKVIINLRKFVNLNKEIIMELKEEQENLKEKIMDLRNEINLSKEIIIEIRGEIKEGHENMCNEIQDVIKTNEMEMHKELKRNEIKYMEELERYKKIMDDENNEMRKMCDNFMQNQYIAVCENNLNVRSDIEELKVIIYRDHECDRFKYYSNCFHVKVKDGNLHNPYNFNSLLNLKHLIISISQINLSRPEELNQIKKAFNLLTRLEQITLSMKTDMPDYNRIMRYLNFEGCVNLKTIIMEKGGIDFSVLNGFIKRTPQINKVIFKNSPEMKDVELIVFKERNPNITIMYE